MGEGGRQGTAGGGEQVVNTVEIGSWVDHVGLQCTMYCIHPEQENISYSLVFGKEHSRFEKEGHGK